MVKRVHCKISVLHYCAVQSSRIKRSRIKRKFSRCAFLTTRDVEAFLKILPLHTAKIRPLCLDLGGKE